MTYTHLYAFATGEHAKQQTKEWIDDTAACLDATLGHLNTSKTRIDRVSAALVLVDNAIEATEWCRVGGAGEIHWSPPTEQLKSARRYLLDRQHQLTPELERLVQCRLELDAEKTAAVAHMVKLRDAEREPCPACGTDNAVSKATADALRRADRFQPAE